MGTEIELIKAKTELLEAKTKLLEAKCLSEAEIIQLIKSNIRLGKIGSDKIRKPPRRLSWVEKEDLLYRQRHKKRIGLVRDPRKKLTNKKSLSKRVRDPRKKVTNKKSLSKRVPLIREK